MLDVHPPHESVHGRRDFVVHLLTITVGLLIALGLEAAVEAMHHHELAAQARENIEHELERNVAHAKQDTANVQATMASVDALLAAARRHRDNPHPDGATAHQMHVDASWEDFEDAAWLTACESGALAHMPLDEVQKYAGVYARQEELPREASVVMTGAPLTLAPLHVEETPDDVAPDDVRTIMLRSADSKVKLLIFKQLVENPGAAYAEARGQAEATSAAAPASLATAASAVASAPVKH